ncbi:MAG: [FeFe] hydrogenase H-cluster maturation GTPase HydF [Candidatus Riflebacteria bacterium]|nr:[FeFe] hydrogenase H-cluster maturation GTPase HydF [Candidatus Riflebacteria bacterium]
MDAAPRGIRPHIAIFGRRNVGKSSLINALADQPLAIVFDTPGTTTDPVYKNMELLPFGPVVLIDTPGLDDIGDLGRMRVEASHAVLKKTDLALVVLEPREKLDVCERDLLNALKAARTPYLVIVNKTDIEAIPDSLRNELAVFGEIPYPLSSLKGTGVCDFRGKIMQEKLKDFDTGPIIGDLVKPGDVVILVVPIDLAAPKGRIILPQVQTIRDLLDSDCITVTVKESELRSAIDVLRVKPALVVTDSQAFAEVAAIVPKGVPFTGFSVLFARYKGDLKAFIDGINSLARLPVDANILIAESCTHHQVADDIGRIKIPRWMRQKYGEGLQFTYSQGISFPGNLSEYNLVVHCGACMTNRRAVLARIATCREAGVPITNYGLLIAHMHGILGEALRPFGLSVEQNT